ncbi:hypothetical protein CPB86DRAFT_389810 [Serendipita vermifera]|nr:hypothetical protein CPB86DRAFT_389810 [Serendipita vermifera]
MHSIVHRHGIKTTKDTTPHHPHKGVSIFHQFHGGDHKNVMANDAAATINSIPGFDTAPMAPFVMIGVLPPPPPPLVFVFVLGLVLVPLLFTMVALGVVVGVVVVLVVVDEGLGVLLLDGGASPSGGTHVSSPLGPREHA